MYIAFASRKEIFSPRKTQRRCGSVSRQGVIHTRVTNHGPSLGRHPRSIQTYHFKIYRVFCGIQAEIHHILIRHLQSLCQEWREKTHAFWLARNLYIDIRAVSTTIPRKALFRRMTSEGKVRQIMKNIGSIFWVLSTEITRREFPVPR